MNFFSEKPYTLDIIVRRVILITILGISIYFLNAISGALVPFIIALIIAYILNPLVVLIEKKIPFLNRTLASIITILTTLTFLTTVFWFLIPYVITEIGTTIDLLNTHIKNNPSFIPAELSNQIFNYLNKLEIKNIFESHNIDLIFEKIGPKVATFFTSTLSFILGVLSILAILLYLFLILIYYEDITNGWYHLVPKEYQKTATDIIKDLNESMNQYFRAQFMISMIVGVLFSIGFLIIGIPLSIVLGITIGFLNLIPYLQTIAIPPIIFLVYVQSVTEGGSFGIGMFKALIIFFVVQGFQDFFLVPKIMGKSTGLNPVVILLSLSIWGSLFGIFGMLIALPMTTVIFSYYNKHFLTGENYFKNNLPS